MATADTERSCFRVINLLSAVEADFSENFALEPKAVWRKRPGDEEIAGGVAEPSHAAGYSRHFSEYLSSVVCHAKNIHVQVPFVRMEHLGS